MSGAAGINATIKPDSMVEGFGRNHVELQPRDDLRIGAQDKCQPKAQRKQAGVRQLVDLRPNLTITSQHGFLQVKRF